MEKRLTAWLLVFVLCFALMPAAMASGEPEASEEAPAAGQETVPAEDGIELPEELSDLIGGLIGGGSGENDNGLTACDQESGDKWGYLVVPVNESATLTVSVQAEDMYGITCGWYEVVTLPLIGITVPRPLLKEGYSMTTEPITEAKQYICRVTDRFGNRAEVNYYVTPDTGLRVWVVGEEGETASAELTLSKGEEPVLTVAAEGAEPLRYVWYAYEQAEGDGYTYWSRTGTVLGEGTSFSAPAVTGPAKYGCVVTDKYGVSADAEIEISIENHFEARAASETVFASPGEEAELRVIAEADEGPFSYQWYAMKRVEENGVVYWQDDAPLPGADGDTLTVTVSEAGKYFCEVTDPYTMQRVYIDVEAENGLTVYAGGTEENFAEIFADPGSTVELSVDAHADRGELAYRWEHLEQGEDDCSEYRPVDGADGPMLTTVPVEHTEEYRCTVTDAYGAIREIWFTVYAGDRDLDPLDANLDGAVDAADAAAFLVGGDAESAVLVLRRVVGLDD